jgi:Domain of unknown function (DUF4430)
MKKIIVSSVIASSLLLGAVGCSQQEAEQPKQEQKVTYTSNIILVDKDGNTSNKEISIEKDQILMDAMKQNFEVEENQGFISGIGSVKADDSKKEYLALYLNGEMASVGANDIKLQDGDEVSFKIETY